MIPSGRRGRAVRSPASRRIDQQEAAASWGTQAGNGPPLSLTSAVLGGAELRSRRAARAVESQASDPEFSAAGRQAGPPRPAGGNTQGGAIDTVERRSRSGGGGRAAARPPAHTRTHTRTHAHTHTLA